MGRRNKLNKKKKQKIVEITDNIIKRDNTDYSIQENKIEEKKSKFFSIFEKSKDKTINDFNEKLELQKKEEEERLKRIEEIKEKAKKDAEEKAKQLKKEKEEKELNEEKEKNIKQSMEIKNNTFASLLSNIKILDNFKEDVSDTKVMMKEILEKKTEKLNQSSLHNLHNLKILDEEKIYTLKFNKNVYSALITLTNLDENEKIEIKLKKHRYQDTANYIIYNNSKIKVDRNNTIVKFQKIKQNIIITGRTTSINIKLKNKNIDCIKVNIAKKNYIWI